jgi:hypothetical protein
MANRQCILLYDQDHLLLQSVSVTDEDPFTLDTFSKLAVEYTSAGKSLILAEVLARGDDDKPVHFFYNANYLNKTLFRRTEEQRMGMEGNKQMQVSQSRIVRVNTLNPMTNTEIVGEVRYYKVQVDNHPRSSAPVSAAGRFGGLSMSPSASSLQQETLSRRVSIKTRSSFRGSLLHTKLQSYYEKLLEAKSAFQSRSRYRFIEDPPHSSTSNSIDCSAQSLSSLNPKRTRSCSCPDFSSSQHRTIRRKWHSLDLKSSVKDQPFDANTKGLIAVRRTFVIEDLFNPVKRFIYQRIILPLSSSARSTLFRKAYSRHIDTPTSTTHVTKDRKLSRSNSSSKVHVNSRCSFSSQHRSLHCGSPAPLGLHDSTMPALCGQLIGTEKDFLEDASFRLLFKENSLRDSEVELFTISLRSQRGMGEYKM